MVVRSVFSPLRYYICMTRLSLFQLHVKEILSFAIATCASTTPWSATVSRTVFTHGMRITAKVPRDTHSEKLTTSHILTMANTDSFFSVSSPLSEKRKASILDTLDHTNLTIIGVTCGLVVLLLVISVIIQVKQPRKKYIIRR